MYLSSGAFRGLFGLKSSSFGRSIVNGISPRFASSSETSQKAESGDSSNAAEDPEKTNQKTEIDEETKKILQQLAETQDKYKRALAETENVRQRFQKQIQDAKLFGIQGFCKDMLEVADILNKAAESVSQEELRKADAALKTLYEGLQMTENQLHKVFTRHGLVRLSPAEGEKFDPNCHEAQFVQPLAEGKTPGTVFIVNKVGYKLHERTLRPALVGVFASK